MIELSKLVQIPLREVWKHEALDFTQWLALPANIELLSDTIGVNITETQTEVGVGQGTRSGCYLLSLARLTGHGLCGHYS